ncbi:dihydrolipoyl dehydrogenase family protein [Halococcoides cellulosivorans]|uniref:NAD(P)/FAD-dependent oxidoreductase n=1 Tax=Halococcoides cellulosivorans TaxID=1679096 RepID=A0A2R4WXK8_9EURY|nr:NAD(P)/FAD-dependent oxidoreductase [Halococcoides cellulosivorans]AWB26277.1 NAD(P)/FAD-dependent oxidoreductase [Halococcoides cellulosivorans]
MSTHVAVIGAYGSAGGAVARRLAGESEIELTLIDDGDPGGGLCIQAGCMPSKELISAAEHRFAARHDDRLDGVSTVEFDRVVDRKDDHTSNWASRRRTAIEGLADRDGVEFVHDTAQFVDDRTIQVGDRTIEADSVVIATGSTLDLPPIPGIEDVPVQTSADVFDATEFADSAVVLGLGYVGLELAPYLSEAAEMDVTALELQAELLPEADPGFGEDLAGYYRDAFDMDVRLDAAAQSIEPTADGGVRVTVEQDGERETMTADELFVFTGRAPNLDGLNLSATTLDPGEDWVRDTMQATSDDRVFVVGDANGREPILHVGKEQAETAAENVLAHRAGDSLASYRSTHHHVIFSGLGRLPYVRVGHSAESADEAGIDHVTVDAEAAADGVFKAKDAPEGRARLVVGTDGTVLGYQGLHYHADVMAKTAQIAVEMGLDVRKLPDRAYHPTTPEILDRLIAAASERLDAREERAAPAQ